MISADRKRTLDYWLGLTVREKRVAQDVRTSEIAGRMRCGDVTVRNFENGKTRPRGVDQFLAAYAELLGVHDPLEFYDLALERWRADGAAPFVDEPAGTPMDRAVGAARRAARGNRSSRGGSRQALVAIPIAGRVAG